MIKTITKIDVQSNEIWQDVYVCNRCKRILDEEEYVYTTKWKSYFPVKPKGVFACGFGAGDNPDIHICENCSTEVQRFWNGEYVTDDVETRQPCLSTFDERVAALKKCYECETTQALKEFSHSILCSAESGKAIALILKDRNCN